MSLTKLLLIRSYPALSAQQPRVPLVVALSSQSCQLYFSNAFHMPNEARSLVYYFSCPGFLRYHPHNVRRPCVATTPLMFHRFCSGRWRERLHRLLPKQSRHRELTACLPGGHTTVDPECFGGSPYRHVPIPWFRIPRRPNSNGYRHRPPSANAKIRVMAVQS